MVRAAIGFLVLCALVTFLNEANAEGLCQESLDLRRASSQRPGCHKTGAAHVIGCAGRDWDTRPGLE